MVRTFQPADLVQDIEMVAKRMDDHGPWAVGEQVGGFLVLDDQDHLGVDGQCVNFRQGRAQVPEAADSCAIGGVGQDHIDVDRQRLQPQEIQVVLFQLLVWLAGVWFVSDVEAGQDEPTVTGKPLGAHAQDGYLPDRQSGTRILGEPSGGLEQDLEVGLNGRLRYRLSPYSLRALRFVRELVEGETTVSSARLGSISHAVRLLADMTSPDRDVQVRRIDRQINELRKRRDDIASGRVRLATLEEMKQQLRVLARDALWCTRLICSLSSPPSY